MKILPATRKSDSLQKSRTLRPTTPTAFKPLRGGSWDLVSKVISTLIGVISIATLIITLV